MDIMERTRTACAELCAVRLPRWSELPDIELYMDQVMALMGKYMAGVASAEDRLTPSMVNNYVKMGIMPAPVKKKYSRSHLAHLIIICVMKQVIPMSVIDNIIRAALTEHTEQQLLDMMAEYYEHAADDAARRTLQRAASVEPDGSGAAELLAASCALHSQIELNLAEKLAKGYEE